MAYPLRFGGRFGRELTYFDCTSTSWLGKKINVFWLCLAMISILSNPSHKKFDAPHNNFKFKSVLKKHWQLNFQKCKYEKKTRSKKLTNDLDR